VRESPGRDRYRCREHSPSASVKHWENRRRSAGVHAYVKKLVLDNRGANGIYIQGSAWRTERIVETLEQELQVPVVHANIAPAIEQQKRLDVNQPVKGYGQLYAELPPLS
jgi:maleate cis-trans isomerase